MPIHVGTNGFQPVFRVWMYILYSELLFMLLSAILTLATPLLAMYGTYISGLVEVLVTLLDWTGMLVLCH